MDVAALSGKLILKINTERNGPNLQKVTLTAPEYIAMRELAKNLFKNRLLSKQQFDEIIDAGADVLARLGLDSFSDKDVQDPRFIQGAKEAAAVMSKVLINIKPVSLEKAQKALLAPFELLSEIRSRHVDRA